VSDGIRTQYKNCSFNFHYNHLQPIDSRKVKVPCWTGKGQCSVTDCSVEVTLTIKSAVVVKHLTVNVSIEGECSHMPISANVKFRLTGEKRRAVGEATVHGKL
jgi:hypothetical protein